MVNNCKYILHIYSIRGGGKSLRWYELFRSDSNALTSIRRIEWCGWNISGNAEAECSARKVYVLKTDFLRFLIELYRTDYARWYGCPSEGQFAVRNSHINQSYCEKGDFERISCRLLSRIGRTRPHMLYQNSYPAYIFTSLFAIFHFFRMQKY